MIMDNPEIEFVSKLPLDSSDNLKKMILILIKRIDNISLTTPATVFTDAEMDKTDSTKLEFERNIYHSTTEVSIKG